jgi:hypothetical protein
MLPRSLHSHDAWMGFALILVASAIFLLAVKLAG